MFEFMYRSQITKITFEGKMFIVHIIVNEVCHGVIYVSSQLYDYIYRVM